MARTAVIGMGTWGTAVAMLLARTRTTEVVLWGREEDHPEQVAATRLHPRLGKASLPEEVRVTGDPGDLVGCDLALWVVPTPFSAVMAQRLRSALSPTTPVVSLSKGIEQVSLRTVTAILADELGQGRDYACLSGPSHAEEVANGLPTGVVVAGPPALCRLVTSRLHGPTFRVYTVDDPLGVELGGALKNVVAIAAGTCDGLQLGDNAKATLITRGLAEMRRLGRAMGTQDATFAGLAGIGDLLTTCYSSHGRNRALGQALASGQTAQEFMAGCGMIAEGAWTCQAAVDLGRRHGIELPIAVQVDAVLWQGRPVREAISGLMARAARGE